MGRPSKYKEKYCDEIIDFFLNHKLTYERVKQSGDNKGGSYEVTEIVANIYPTITDFAKSINVNRCSISQWAKDHKEFSNALKEAKELQTEIIVKCALAGYYTPGFSCFALKNIAGWRDSKDLHHTGDLKTTAVNIIYAGEKKELNAKEELPRLSETV